MKTAIITGISGQDGAYLSKLLIEKKYKVVGVTRRIGDHNKSKLEYLNIQNHVLVEECDLLDIASVILLIKKIRPNEIYNLAAQSSVGLSFNEPIGTIKFNVESVLNILEAIKLLDREIRFYQASSSEMFGKVSKLPINEETPMHPLSPYAVSKASAHWIVVNYRESCGLFACNGILFNHESFLRSSNFFIKKIIKESVYNRENKDWKLNVGNINIKRDFGFSPDYVKAMWLMLQSDRPQDYIICSGKSITLRSIIEYVFNKLDISLNKIYIDKNLFRPTEIEDIYGDNNSAKINLGWDNEKNFYDTLDLLIAEEINNIT